MSDDQPVALLPAWSTWHHRREDGLTFPDYVNRRAATRAQEIEHLEAQLQGVQRRLSQLRREENEQRIALAVYMEVASAPGVPLGSKALPASPPKATDKRFTKHGSNSTYSYGCRCDDCRRAHADYNNRLRWNKKGKTTNPEKLTHTLSA